MKVNFLNFLFLDSMFQTLWSKFLKICDNCCEEMDSLEIEPSKTDQPFNSSKQNYHTYPEINHCNCDQLKTSIKNNKNNNEFTTKLKRLQKLKKATIADENQNGWKSLNPTENVVRAHYCSDEQQNTMMNFSDQKSLYDVWRRKPGNNFLSVGRIREEISFIRKAVRRTLWGEMIFDECDCKTQ